MEVEVDHYHAALCPTSSATCVAGRLSFLHAFYLYLLAAASEETADLAPIRFQHQLCLEVNLLPSPPPHRTAPYTLQHST